MQRVLLVLLVAMLAMGCAKKKTSADDSAAVDPFDVTGADNQALETGGVSADDIAQPKGPGSFGEAGSGMLNPAVDAEARVVMQDIHFAYDSATIMIKEASILDQIGGFLKKYPQVIIQIEGHCDERGTEEYNMALGSRRANAAREHLARQCGIEPNRLYTISYGEMRPAAPGHDVAAYSLNRRCHFLVGMAK